MTQEPDFRWMARDLREQLGSVMDTLVQLRRRCDALRQTLLFHVDQGEGLTENQLAEVYAEFERLFPRRVRKTSDELDAPLGSM